MQDMLAADDARRDGLANKSGTPSNRHQGPPRSAGAESKQNKRLALANVCSS